MRLEARFDDQGNPLVQHYFLRPFSLRSGRTCPEVRLGFCVFAEKANLPVVILHPALTGSPKAWIKGRGSQGDGWFSDHVGVGKLLDPSRHCIVCVDPLGGNGASSSAQELATFSTDLSFADGIEACALFLREQGVSEIEAVVGGSIGGGQAFEWLFQNNLKVKKIFDISGSACRTNTATEFFLLQAELLDFEKLGDTNLVARLSENTSDLLGLSKAFDIVFHKIKKNLESLLSNYSLESALKVARQIGFLRFLTPNFYENKFQSYLKQLDSEQLAQDKLISWIEHQGQSFPSRFSAQSLRQLCYMDSMSQRRSPAIVAEAIYSRQIQFVGFSVLGDMLFPHAVQEKFYNQVRDCLPLESQSLVHFFSERDELNGHDHFLSAAFAKSANLLKEFL